MIIVLFLLLLGLYRCLGFVTSSSSSSFRPSRTQHGTMDQFLDDAELKRTSTRITLSMSFGLLPKKVSKQPEVVTRLLESVCRSQSPTAAITVEKCISQLSEFAQNKPSQYLKKECTGVWKTVWTSVSSGEVPNIFGWGTSPANILGGSSYQVIFPNGAAENIVWWPSLWNIRMVGKAQLSGLSVIQQEEHQIQAGYNLVIRGLEFRYGSPLKIPEVKLKNAAKSSDDVIEKGGGRRWAVFELGEDDEPLANGQGTLKILFNDANLRVTRDLDTQIAYVHAKVV